MITIKDFMELVNYRITEGDQYCWACFGGNAYSLDSWNGDQDGYSASIVFDTNTQTVYEAQVCDYRNKRAYRLQHPDFTSAYRAEAERRGVNPAEAWMEDWDSGLVTYVDLEVDEDFAEKVRAIVAGEEYDTRVQVELDLTEKEQMQLMSIAHQRDITLNQLVEQILEEEIARRKGTESTVSKPEGQPCNQHPKAPHGFDRNASHNAGHYVCECAGWEPYQAGYDAGFTAGYDAGFSNE